MKRKLKTKLLAILFALLSLFLLAGCKMGLTFEEATKGLDVHITYHANGGSFGGSNIKEKTLYCKTDTCPLDIGNASISSGSISVEREQFKLLGWHYAVLDESTGKPKVNEETGAYELGEAVDFKLALPSS